MGKRVILYLFLLFSLSLQAQTEEKVSLGNDSTEVDSTATAKPSAFKRAIKKFMNFSDFDTLYISPNRYNYALMVTHFSNFEYYSITSELPQPQKLSFSPNPHNKIGLYFGWRWIFLGWSVDVNDIFKKGTRKNRGTEFDLSLYSSKLGVDIFYRRTGNDYKIHKIRGFSDDIPSNYSEDFSGIKVDIKGLNLYYISNKEWIWGFPQIPSQSDASYNFYYLDATYVGAYSSFMADPHLKDTFTEGDIRLPLFQWMREGYLGYKKFHMRADDTADLVLMRAAEMYLIEAEAKVRDGVALAQAVAPLNTLRNARGVGDYEVTGKSQEDVINEILMERRRELWGEGFGITDILRTQKAVERAALSDEMQKTEVDCWQEGGSFEKRNPLGHWFLNFPNGKPFTVNSTYYLYAIPQKEINANPNI